MYEKHKPRFSIVFLNLIAHAQHHYWTTEKELSPQLVYTFRVIDRILKMGFKRLDSESEILIANAFSQSNTASDPAWILYRPTDPLSMLQTIGIQPAKIEALMTHDMHVWSQTPAENECVRETLESASVTGQPLFLVEQDAKDELKLFCRLQFTDAVTEDSMFTVRNRSYKFNEHFQTVVKRTGKHNPHGFAMQSRRFMPEQLNNLEMYNYICRFFEIEPTAATVRETPGMAKAAVSV
jgi:hypothetical protein